MSSHNNFKSIKIQHTKIHEIYFAQSIYFAQTRAKSREVTYQANIKTDERHTKIIYQAYIETYNRHTSIFFR